MPRKITHPYTRETALMEDGKPVLICLNPPGYSIGFRPKHGRETYHLTMERAYELAQQETAQGHGQKVTPRPTPTPKPAPRPAAKARPEVEPIPPHELKKLRIQKSLAEAMERLVDLVEKTNDLSTGRMAS